MSRGVRDFPMPVWPNRGWMWCRWCGESIPKVINGKKSSQRLWHPHCKDEWQLHIDRDVQRRYVVDRDGDCCRICGEAPQRWFKGSYYSNSHDWRGHEARFEGWGLPNWKEELEKFNLSGFAHRGFTETWMISALELDHRVPLWSVADLVDEERRPFFHPRNLWLLCPKHHRQKSAREAAERASIRSFIKAQIPLPLPDPI